MIVVVLHPSPRAVIPVLIAPLPLMVAVPQIPGEGNVMGTMLLLSEIARVSSEIIADKDWHKLNHKEKELVSFLEEAGYLTKKKVPDGFVGRSQMP